MNKIAFLFFALLLVSSLSAQWSTTGTNIYYDIGNVGIGISTPTSKLDVRNSTNGSAGLSIGYFDGESTTSITNGITALQGVGKFSHSTGTANRIIGVSGIAFNTGSGNVISMRAIQGNVSMFGSGNATEAFCFMGGIGLAGSGIVTNGYGLYIGPFASAITNKWGVYISDANAKNYFGGNVAIGTTSDHGYKLAVNGNAIFTEAKVKLYTSWPDYVFLKNYKLLPLNELEKFIQQNNHLPNIPSAQEIKEKGGFELGNMSTKLLEKIEELTLYLIDLKKENELLRKRLDALEINKEKINPTIQANSPTIF